MKTKTNIKAGSRTDALTNNHNQTLVRPLPRRALKVKSHLKAGSGIIQGNGPRKP